MSARVDVAVVGAGFGGLAAALCLAERGRSVVLFEALDYPGGCAGTFTRGGARHQAGATLVSGLGPGQLFARWRERHGLALEALPLEPVLELRSALGRIRSGPRRETLLDELSRFDDAPRAALERFFTLQERVADRLWPFVDQAELLPPLHGDALLRFLRALPGLARVAPLVGRPLAGTVNSLALERFAPFTLWLEAACRITVQCGWREAEAPLALAALDHPQRGARHLVGGVGALAWELARAFERRGGELRLGERVRTLAHDSDGWRVESKGGTLTARAVLANVLPEGLRRLAGLERGAHARLERLARAAEGGWSACTLYLLARAPADAGAQARHLALVLDAERPLVEGNHAFASISARDDGLGRDGLRSITLSTHVAPRLADPPSPREQLEQAERVAAVQERMREALRVRAPEWAAGVVEELSGSPRTFERFTARPHGLVGGVPRRAGLGCYRELVPRALLPGLWLVGDTLPPGQGTLAAAVGGACSARALDASLGARRAARGAARRRSA